MLFVALDRLGWGGDGVNGFGNGWDVKSYANSLKNYDFDGSRGFPGSSRQLSTCRIDLRGQIQHPEVLDQPETLPK